MKKHIVVVDIPADAKADQLEELLNALCNDGYYLLQLTSTRAFFKLRVKQNEG